MAAKYSQPYTLLQNKECSSTEQLSTIYEEESEDNYSNGHRRSVWERIVRFSIHQACILTIYTVVLFAIYAKAYGIRLSSTSEDGLLYTPMQNAFKYKVKTVGYNFDAINAFKGPPVEQIDEEWDHLLNAPHELIFTPSQMQQANLSSIPLSSSSNQGSYIVQPTSYHMLHCLYSLYKYVHPEFYGPDPNGWHWIVKHTDHCVDNLRQFVQCHAGSGVSTYKWLDDAKVPWGELNAREVCVDWDHYAEWITEHSVPAEQLATLTDENQRPLLVHPELGALTNADYGKDTESVDDLGSHHEHRRER